MTFICVSTDAYRSITLIPLLNRLNSRVSKKKGCTTTIEYSKLQEGTNKFSSNNILGDGGFGCVYKARFDNDSFATMKKLDESSRQAEHEFQVGIEHRRHYFARSLLLLPTYEDMSEGIFLEDALMLLF